MTLIPRLMMAVLTMALLVTPGCNRVERKAEPQSGHGANHTGPHAGPGDGRAGHRPDVPGAVVLQDMLDQAEIEGLAAHVAAGEPPVTTRVVLSEHFDDRTLGSLVPEQEVRTGHGPSKRAPSPRVESGNRAYQGHSLRLVRKDGQEARVQTRLIPIRPGHTYTLTYRVAVYRYSHKKTRFQRKPRVGRPVLELFSLEANGNEPGAGDALHPLDREAAEPLEPPDLDHNSPWMTLGDTFVPGSGATHFRIVFGVAGTRLLPGQKVSAEVWYDDIVLTETAAPPSTRYRPHPPAGSPAPHPLEVEVELRHPMRRKATEKRYGILAPAPSTLRFAFEVPPGAVFSFGHGFIPELSTGTGEGKVAFEVHLKDAQGESHTLYQREKSLDDPADRWIDAEVDLSDFAGQQVTLSLVTRGRSPDDLSLLEALARGPEAGMVWSFPVVHSPQRPGKTIVLVVWDTVPAKATSLVRTTPHVTPRLRRLAEHGTRFERALTPSPWTLPSFASIFTGLHPLIHRAGELDPRTIRGKRTLPRTIATLTTALREAGWETRAWINNPYLTRHFGLDRGFTDYIDYDARETLRASEQAVEQAVAYLSKPRGYDRFVFFHFMDPHGPYLPHQPYRERFAHMFPRGKALGESLGQLYRSVLMHRVQLTERQKRGYRELYDAVVAYTDHQTGRLYDALVTGAGGDSLFVVTADHGEEFWEHDHYEHGHTLYDELLHVPLVIAGTTAKGRVLAGRRVERPVSLQDIAPTLLAYADVRDRLGEGVSLLPVLLEGAVPRERTFFSAFTLYGYQRLGIERAGWKLVYNQQGLGRPSLRTGDPIAPLELYRIAADPGETRNVAAQYPNLVVSMLDDLAAHYLGTQRGRLFLVYVGDTRSRVARSVEVTVRLDGGPRWKHAVRDVVWPGFGRQSDRLEIRYREPRNRSVITCAFDTWKALLSFAPSIGTGPVRVEGTVEGRPLDIEVVHADGRREPLVRGPVVVSPEGGGPSPLDLLKGDLRAGGSGGPRLVVLYEAREEESEGVEVGGDTADLESQLRALGYVE